MHRVAFRRWLIAGLILFSPSLAAQQESQELTATVDDGQGMAVESPSSQDAIAEQPASENQPPEAAPENAPALENERTAEPTCGEHCQATEQREKDDLIAQQSMAGSTADMVVAVWWQFGLGIIGIILLGITARYAYRAARAAEHTVTEAKAATSAAQDAVTVARDIAQRQLQAYVGLSGINILMEENGYVTTTFKIKNSGQTPAYQMIIRTSVTITPFPLQEDFPTDTLRPDEFSQTTLFS